MEIRTLTFSARALALGALLAASALCVAADTPGGKATAKDVSKKAGETGRAIKDYTVLQRDEALKQAKAALDDVDSRIHSGFTRDLAWARAPRLRPRAKPARAGLPPRTRGIPSRRPCW